MEHLVSEGGAVIFNPTAGRGLGGRMKDEVQGMLGPQFEWIPTRRPGDAIELAAEAAKRYPVVVAFGGDGTVGDVARGLFGSDAILGVLPVGTGNDFARNLGLPLRLEEAVAAIHSGAVKKVDVGLLNGTPFVNNAGLGFDAQVMVTMNRGLKKVRGNSAFMMAILKTFPGFKPFGLEISIDGGDARQMRAMMVSVLNGKMYAAGMIAAPHAEMDDGRMDVLIIKALPKLQLLPLIGKVRNGTHLNHPAVEIIQARSLSVRAIPGQPLNIDGDVRGVTPANIEVKPGALKVFVR